MDFTQFFNPHPVHFLIRCSKIVEMIVLKVGFIIIFIKIERGVKLVPIPEGYIVNMKCISHITMLLQ
ncbi:hypothetical protein D3C74_222840 [compost metagenome]